MPDSVELSVERVLGGLALEGEESEICDFSLEEQNAACESQGVQPTVSPNFKPVIGETVTYVVAVVLINDHNEVLMMQEAKESCAGKWYLPAGRIEKGETISEAGQREVLEETGLHVQCTTLIMVECARGSWIRYVLTGVATGGKLKTPAEADKESLQAKWVANLGELTLRATDIMDLINRARAFKEARKARDQTWHKDQLPCLRPHSRLLLRLVVVIKKKATNRVHVLISEKTSWHLPTCEIHPSKNLHSTLKRFMVDLFGADVGPHRPHGLLSVEYDPRDRKDGACLTLLVAFRPPLEEVPIIGKCVWHEASKELGERLLAKVASKNSTIPIHVIC
ncbi:8-oxo-dGDP phosphatase NUDT18 [Tribolium castaneum]|uniref:8-oxo-dGDP phosphatase NUDT18-like Protein n=1 Tax=Tribolium castaneum TaxID=7070 RepID=D6X526_TRICA|nr:PREDICTED: 8-oxo-dGDP phosphatase NUDT18 [Tribolium castaneum]EEZ97187.1 8-oxo-dGDP phosphatase NUDT18-like Protein [Tribolium castaneum]|eukprot:XP_966613.1 PREDICTED: 8-oxo-dGDP phosphatase NUDT18 [Tribolium castaneum]